jgi:predicted cobalt transporter CbtA
VQRCSLTTLLAAHVSNRQLTDLTEADVTAHVERFTAAFEQAASVPGAVLPHMSSDGCWLQAYGFSKAAMNAWTRVLAAGRGKHLQVNACRYCVYTCFCFCFSLYIQ